MQVVVDVRPDRQVVLLDGERLTGAGVAQVVPISGDSGLKRVAPRCKGGRLDGLRVAVELGPVVADRGTTYVARRVARVVRERHGTRREARHVAGDLGG